MRRQTRQRGFVLVMTMWILAAVAIAASYFAERVQKSLQLAAARQNMNDGMLALSDARAELLFRLATTPMTPYGVGNIPSAIALDGRTYAVGNTTVQLQDGRGLFNLNVFGDEQMQRFLGTLGVPSDQRSRLIDSLRDYTDDDDLRRLNGAEAQQYKEMGLEPPRNAPLISPIELRRIIGWRDMSTLWQNEQLLELTNADQGFAINPNTAPWQVLTAIPGVTEDIAKALIERRQIEPISVALLERMLGVQFPIAAPPVWSFPSGSIRITQAANGLPWVLRYNVRLSPTGELAPWEITYSYRLPKKADAGPAADPSKSQSPSNAPAPPKLPPRSALPAAPTLLFAN